MTDASALTGPFELRPVEMREIPHLETDDLSEFWATFRLSCEAIAADAPELRKGVPPGDDLRGICRKALDLGPGAPTHEVRAFISRNFAAHLIVPAEKSDRAFFTAYYRPEVSASLVSTLEHHEPLLARPDDLVTLPPGDGTPGLEGLTSAQRRADGSLSAYPTRAEIDSGALGDAAKPVAFVRDAIEAFMIQVQGSARLILEDGACLDLTYAGRNGRPYTSIGKQLIERGAIAPADMSLDRLKTWVREAGQEIGQPGRNLLHSNESFVFFAAERANAAGTGPIGAAGVPLTPLRSIAIDRAIWPYGLPFWVEAELPWRNAKDERFTRLMVGQDTGSAIVGAARADLFFGDGPHAGRLAGSVRHNGRMFVFLPRSELP